MTKEHFSLEEIEKRMKPGCVSLLGFLGEDGRSLGEILSADDRTVKLWGLTHKQLAARMEELRDAGRRGLGEFIHVPPHFEVRVDAVRGGLLCPFGDPGLHPKTNIIVRNLILNIELDYSDLHIHLIGEHGFYEGKGFVYRLEPEDIISVLEIVCFPSATDQPATPGS